MASMAASALMAGCSDVEVDDRDAADRLKGPSLGDTSDRDCSIELVVLLVMYVSCDPSRLALVLAR